MSKENNIMKGFMFYNHFEKVVSRLSDIEKGKFLDCLINYNKNKTFEPGSEIPAVVDIAFRAVQPDIDKYVKSCVSKMKYTRDKKALEKKENESATGDWEIKQPNSNENNVNAQNVVVESLETKTNNDNNNSFSTTSFKSKFKNPFN